MNVLSAAKKALILLKNNPLLVLLSICIDVSALFLYGFLSGPVYAKMTEHIILIGTLISQNLQASRGKSIMTILYQPDTSEFAKQLILLLLFLLCITYVIFVISQGLNLALAKKIARQKTHTISQIKTVAKIALFWSIVLAILYPLRLLADIRLLLITKVTPNQTSFGLVDTLNILTVLFVIIALHQFALGTLRNSFSWILQHYAIVTKSSALIILVFFAINTILKLLNSIAGELSILGGLFLVFPALIWLRLYMIELVRSHGIYSHP